MTISNLIAFVICMLLPTLVAAEPQTQAQVVAKAEEFVLQNGYTNAPAAKLQSLLDHESIERTSGRDELVKWRFNTLKSQAIGIRKGGKNRNGWSVAFDYVKPSMSESRAVCRVVTMRGDGTDMRIEHQDAFRDSFMGFSG